MANYNKRKLTKAIVARLRYITKCIRPYIQGFQHEVSDKGLARRLGVAETSIWAASTGDTWKHVNDMMAAELLDIIPMPDPSGLTEAPRFVVRKATATNEGIIWERLAVFRYEADAIKYKGFRSMDYDKWFEDLKGT